MSGGHFDYEQNRIGYISDEIDRIVSVNTDPELREYGEQHGLLYSPETIERFREAVRILNQAYTYAQRIDWLVSGDDSEESFHERLREDLEDCQ